MNWIATNIRFPEDMYMELKLEAAKKRKSVAALVREKVAVRKSQKNAKLMQKLEKLAKRIRKQNPHLNLTKALIEMRYEQ